VRTSVRVRGAEAPTTNLSPREGGRALVPLLLCAGPARGDAGDVQEPAVPERDGPGGFEDNPYYRPGELAASNAQLIERLVRIAREIGRQIASPAEARTLLGLPPRQPG
jgi:hypothetical protein